MNQTATSHLITWLDRHPRMTCALLAACFLLVAALDVPQ